MSIICSQDDILFKKYENQINDKKVKYHIKDIFEEHWNKFLKSYPNINIRETVFDNINKMLKCKTLDLGFDVLNVLIVVKKNFVFILVNLDYVLLVVINIIPKGKLPFFLNYLNLTIGMLFGLFQKNLGITLEKIVKDYHFYSKQVKLL